VLGIHKIASLRKYYIMGAAKHLKTKTRRAMKKKVFAHALYYVKQNFHLQNNLAE
jgi:hypothetical protein